MMAMLALAGALFAVGFYCVLVRREIIAMLAGVEIMLGAASLLLVALASAEATTPHGMLEGVGVLLLVLAAAEAAVGLGLLVALVRRGGSSRIDEVNRLEG